MMMHLKHKTDIFFNVIDKGWKAQKGFVCCEGDALLVKGR